MVEQITAEFPYNNDERYKTVHYSQKRENAALYPKTINNR